MPITKKLELSNVPISKLMPYAKNPRKNDEAVQRVAKSLEEFGLVKNSIVVDEDMVLITGHTTTKAMQVLGWKNVPEVTQVFGLTAAQKQAYRIADNKLGELAEWDAELLGLELEELRDLDFDIELTGFDEEEFDDMLKELHKGDEVQDAEPQVNRAEELQKEWHTELGQMWQCGEHRVICGDCTDNVVVERLMQGEKADMAFTDPPYGISVVQGKTKKIGGGGSTKFKGKVGGGNIVNSREYSEIIGDESTDAAKNSLSVIADIKNKIIFGGNYFTDFLPASRCWIVWDKENTGNFADAELAWTSFDRGVKLYHWLWNGLSRKGGREEELKSRVHPTQKPVGLFKEILNDFSKDGEIILDPFLGSGTTMIACENTGRICYGCEISPEYVAVILQRYKDTFPDKEIKLL